VNGVTHSPCLIITPGEPAGIGPDITLKVATQSLDANIFAIADPSLLEQRARLLNIDVKLNVLEGINTKLTHKPNTLNILPVALSKPATAGILNNENNQYVLNCLKQASELCMTKKADAIVTGPVHKGIINDGGIAFTGHTEFLAELSNSKPVMMLATQKLRVALTTTHLPLNKVSEAITSETLEYVINTLHNFLVERCNIEKPTLLVCGLNPHAGEDGHLGMEEIEIISPTLETCRKQGINIIGPIPADTAFTKKYLEKCDAVLAMYHDQGLPVLKHSGFGEAVNLTLGLPYTRTSVDHGTALDLAGTGNANESSLLAAINMAHELHYN
jgi:4-hydroxythreonine-4-phosphate dehydrogenase